MYTQLKEQLEPLLVAARAGQSVPPEQLKTSIESMAGTMLILKSLSEDAEIVKHENLKNCVIWYWKSKFRDDLLGVQVQMLNDFTTRITTELEECRNNMAGNPDRYRVDPHTRAQRKLEQLKTCLKGLTEVLGTPAAPQPSPSPNPFASRPQEVGNPMNLNFNLLDISPMTPSRQGSGSGGL